MTQFTLSGVIGGLEVGLNVDVQTLNLVPAEVEDYTTDGGMTISGGEFQADGSGNARAYGDAVFEMLPGDHDYGFEVLSTDGTSEVRISVGGASELVSESDTAGVVSGTLNIPADNQTIMLSVEDTVAAIDRSSFFVRRKID